MSDDNFYASLAPFEGFKGISDEANYSPAPEDWWIFVADLADSTSAVEQGRYKDINTIGAAAIVVAHDVMGEQPFPFVFGGDGAVMIVPPEMADSLAGALIGLKELAKNQFGFALRVGKIRISEVTAKGASVKVAKMTLAGAKSIAIFSGGGLSLADKLIKEKSDAFEVTGDATANDLKRLSCRWQAVKSRHGKMVSMVVSATNPQDMETIAEFVDFLDEIYAGNLADSNPIGVDHMSYCSISECVAHEKRLHDSVWSKRFLLRFLEIVLAVAIYRYNIPPLLFNPDDYGQSLSSHSDYRKFDDTLKMTIDCSERQLEQINAYLADKHAAGKLVYGLRAADTALMTCFVNGLGYGQHIHFVDGGDGGYFSASASHKALSRAGMKA